MAITKDTSASTHATSWTTTVTLSYTVGTGNNRILVAGFGWYNGATTISSFTYNSVEMTYAISEVAEPNGFCSALYYMIAPPVGTYNIVVTLSASSDLILGASSWFGVNQGGGSRTISNTNHGYNTSGTPTITCVSDINELVQSNVFCNKQILTDAGGQTSQWSEPYAGDNVIGGGSTKDGASSVTLSYTGDGTPPWGAVAMSMKPFRRIIIIE